MQCFPAVHHCYVCMMWRVVVYSVGYNGMPSPCLRQCVQPRLHALRIVVDRTQLESLNFPKSNAKLNPKGKMRKEKHQNLC